MSCWVGLHTRATWGIRLTGLLQSRHRVFNCLCTRLNRRIYFSLLLSVWLSVLCILCWSNWPHAERMTDSRIFDIGRTSNVIASPMCWCHRFCGARSVITSSIMGSARGPALMLAIVSVVVKGQCATLHINKKDPTNIFRFVVLADK